MVQDEDTRDYTDEQRRELTARIVQTSGAVSITNGVSQKLGLYVRLSSYLDECANATDDSASALLLALK